MNIKTTLGLLTIIALTAMACSQEDLMTGYTISVQTGTLKQKANTIAITGGFAEVNEVELEKDTDQFDLEVDIEGIYRFDIMTGTSNPTFPITQIPSGTYHELEIGLGQEENDTSMYIEATYTDAAGNLTDMEIALTDDIWFEIEDEYNGINIDPNTISPLSVTVDLEKILASLNWDNVQLINGIIVVNSTTNADHYESILAKLNIEIEFEEDDD